ncbi:MAG: hypothetical protein HOP10_15355 [Chitinophagaceae bacterium]|nr:hypothetical protein [Chitinophagaceae bacterium]
MKGLLMIAVYSILLSLSMSSARARQHNGTRSVTLIFDSINFTAHIVPLLQKKCSPCHFEGGKMYGKMPFDRVATLIIHQAGILKRFSNENEKALLDKFIHVHTAK